MLPFIKGHSFCLFRQHFTCVAEKIKWCSENFWWPCERFSPLVSSDNNHSFMFKNSCHPGIYLKLINLNLLSMSNDPKDAHIFHKHSISTFYLHQVRHYIYKFLYQIPWISNHVRTIHRELGKLESILLEFHVTLC